MVLVTPRASQAQSTRDSGIVRALSQIPGGAPIRVALLRSRWTGAYMGTRGDSVFLGVAGQPPMVVLFNAVDTLWRSERATKTLARRGALWTGLAGGVAMAVVGANVGGGEDAVPVGLVGAAVGAASGAIVGAVIGSRLRHWRRVFAVPAVSPF
jgi:hypothetical protein